MNPDYTFSSNLRRWTGKQDKGTRLFVTVPVEISEQIKASTKDRKRNGFGSIKVEVEIGYIPWKTSIFPSKEMGTYVLPIKKAIRNQLQIGEGDEVMVGLRVVT